MSKIKKNILSDIFKIEELAEKKIENQHFDFGVFCSTNKPCYRLRIRMLAISSIFNVKFDDTDVLEILSAINESAYITQLNIRSTQKAILLLAYAVVDNNKFKINELLNSYGKKTWNDEKKLVDEIISSYHEQSLPF